MLEGYADPYADQRQALKSTKDALQIPYTERVLLPEGADSARLTGVVTTDGCGECSAMDTITLATIGRPALPPEPAFVLEWMEPVFRVREKVVQGRGEARLQFVINRHDINLAMGRNRAELEDMVAKLGPVLGDTLATLTRLDIYGMASADRPLYSSAAAQSIENVQVVVYKLSDDPAAEVPTGAALYGNSLQLVAQKKFTDWMNGGVSSVYANHGRPASWSLSGENLIKTPGLYLAYAVGYNTSNYAELTNFDGLTKTSTANFPLSVTAGTGVKYVVNGYTPVAADAKFYGSGTNDAHTVYEVNLAEWFTGTDMDTNGDGYLNEKDDSWKNKLNEGNANNYSVVRNHLYNIGERDLGDNPGEDPNPGTDPDDKPQDLNNETLVLKVNDNWEAIHQMEID